MPAHPLQPALDRSSRALRTVTDLVEIAKGRKSANGRSDARQSSLYRAIVAASVGVAEEGTEALVTETLRAQGIPSPGVTMLETAVARLMQTPNSDEIKKLLLSFTGYDPTPAMKVRLRTSAPAFRNPTAFGTSTSYDLWTIYNRERNWSGDNAAQVWNRFVKIRHSFAHQDSSVAIFSKGEVGQFRTSLSTRRAANTAEIDFIESLNAVAAVRVHRPASSTDDPVRDWRLHETHAINALLSVACIVTSITDGLADFLDVTGTVSRSGFDPLHFDIEKGDWVALAGPSLATSPCRIGWTLTDYKPGSRTI